MLWSDTRSDIRAQGLPTAAIVFLIELKILINLSKGHLIGHAI